MKICFLGLENLPVLAKEYNSHGIGGEQVQHTLLAKALTRAGHEVSMVVYDYGQDDGARWDDVTTYKAYRASSGLPVVRFIHPRWTGVWAALRRADADVYYTSCAGMHLGLLAMFCRKHNKRLVFRLASDSDCEPDKLLVKYWRDKKLYEYGLHRCDVILAQSERQQAAMLRNYGILSVVAEMPVESPEELIPYESRSIDVLWVSNIRQLKRPDLYLQLAKELPDIGFHMIGGPMSGSHELYEKVIAASSSISNLKFHGRVPYHDVGPMYGQAKVFVNTSDTEGFPNSFLQSWIHGTPVVSFFDPDATIKREKLGCAVTSLDEMKASIRTLLGNRNVFEETSARCSTFMELHYGDSRILAPYLKAIEKEAA